MEPLALSRAVAEALDAGRPVVALETSVLAHGLPRPRNLEALERMDRAVRDAGAEPAWVSVLGGAVRVGTPPEELRRLAEEGGAAKVARRDLPAAVASGRVGATTVSATVWAAHRAGVEVVATGGTGGVHPGTGDVSADLLELARTPVTLVCSGPKSVLDPAATAERLEELGVLVLGYRCDRLPFFVVREAEVPLEHRVETAEDAARVARARRALGVESAVLLCNPVAEAHALDREEVRLAVGECLGRAAREGVAGKAVTPFLLSCLAERTQGRSLEANLALLEANARLAGEVARTLESGGAQV
ncbi:MAG TPA: pseudouridine-5'-phosphate glycosidase [Actinomycetota bacterium]|nr:pseudouridine-5'-phosphate glycosidase [Actinomycetota bacterium]